MKGLTSRKPNPVRVETWFTTARDAQMRPTADAFLSSVRVSSVRFRVAACQRLAPPLRGHHPRFTEGDRHVTVNELLMTIRRVNYLPSRLRASSINSDSKALT